MELSALIRQSQADMERGDYKTAVRLCEHALVHAPSCFTARRLLGECALEMHDVDAAIEHLQTALNFDPMSVVVHLGMGVAAEERHDVEAAYACYLHAWEINPGLDHVRDRLVMLRRARGVDPRLHLTRAGLASVHLRAGRIDRAITELRALVEAEPQARRARGGLVAALWRGGDDASAAALCRGGLDQAPENGRYLAVLAEIEHRLQLSGAASTLARLHAIDPFGEIATVMADWRPDRDVSVLFADAIAVPEPALIDEPALFEAGTARLVASAAVVEPDEMLKLPEDMRIETPVGVGRAVAGLDASIRPFVWDESPSAPRSFPAPAIGRDDWRNPTPVAAAHDTAAPSSNSVPANIPSSFETSDGVLDLTAGWDDLDQALADATPPAAADDRFADLLAELRIEGLAPFDMSDGPSDDAAWEPLFAADDEPMVQAVVPAATEMPVLSVAAEAGATNIGIPAPLIAQPAAASTPSDEFDGLLPFAFDDVEAPVVSVLDGGFDFSDLDVATVAPSRPERVSMLIGNAGSAVAAASAETFPDRAEALESMPIAAAVASPHAEAPASIFQVLRASKTGGSGRPAAPAPNPEPAPMFHVEHSAAPAANQRRFAIDRDELMTLRIRLIEEEHSAGEIARTLEAKLSDSGEDPLAARVLGEAYLRLGKSDQAAAQFRQAMLSGRARRNPVASAAR